MNLTQYAQYQQNWGTPNHSDAKGTGQYNSEQYQHDIQRGYLRAQVIEAPAQGLKLNPDWVEMLMGYPTGWTDINFQLDETATI